MDDKKRKKLLLVTAGFPYGESERGFFSTEFRHLCERFDISILAVGSKEPLIYPLDEAVTAEWFYYKSFGRSVSGLFTVACNFCRPQVIRELVDAAKGQRIKDALSRAKQIVAYRVNAQCIEKRMRQIVQERQIDLIYTYWCTEATLAAVCLKKSFPDLKVVTRFHGYDLYHERSYTGRLPFRRLIADEIDRLFFACKTGESYFLDTWGKEYEGKSRVCYLGTPNNVPMPLCESGQLCLISCSNMIPLKRIELIIDGLSRLPDSVKVVWNHFGDGCGRQLLEQMAREKLPLGGNVEWKFWGQIPNGELLSRYREIGAQLFITTSSTEGGVPVSLQEAAAMGVPAVGTAVGGIQDLIFDMKTGILLPENSQAEDVAGAIMKYMSLTAEQRQQMSEAVIRLWEERFDAEKNAKEFTDILKQVISESMSL